MERRIVAAVIGVTVLLTTAWRAEPAQVPSVVSVDGGPELTLVARADRTELLGTVPLYRVSIYADSPTRDLTRLASADVTKSIRVVVSYEDDLHSRIDVDWSRELIPRVETGAAGHLRGSFMALRKGNVVAIDYVPSKGTSVRVDRAVAVMAAPHELMLAFLDQWIGQRPLSEDLKRSLLESTY